MLAKLFEIKNAGDNGKGLFAKEQIPKGTIVSFECQDCIRMSNDDFEFIPTNKEKSLILKYGYRKAMLKTMAFRQAARVTVVGDTASIAAMEITENSLAFIIPGFMHAAITDALFWLGLGIILPAGYVVAYPAMYWAMKREQKRGGISAHHH
jgi:hypothetical protein